MTKCANLQTSYPSYIIIFYLFTCKFLIFSVFLADYQTIRPHQIDFTHQEVIGDCSHALMSQNNVNDQNVTDHRHRHDGAISGSPQTDLPRRLDELVEATATVGSVRAAAVCGVQGERIHPLRVSLRPLLDVTIRCKTCYWSQFRCEESKEMRA